ncbi:MAG TPA: ATP-binding protein [Verrucomicrobiae bacterium]|nr:ATP-binding protein [Verrucomicrobiae bacterium]
MNSDIVFGLEGAAWPALLLDAGCAILRSNSAALTLFGAPLKAENAPLANIWSQENPMPPQDFFSQWEKAPSATGILKFRAATGETQKFVAAICAFGKNGQKWFVLQLLPTGESIATTGATAQTAAADNVTSAPVADAGGVVLKQKLDCALQLARTISLDFNNALTSVLGHTSLLLSKAEAGHPWRMSLMEVEKSAARAAEIANELQMFSRQEKEVKRAPLGNLNAVVNRCVDFFKNTNGDKIAWNLQLETNLFAAHFDEAKVQQALTKILENAAEAVIAAGRGQVTVQTRNVELSEATQDRNVRLAAGVYDCVEISDTGIGIDAETLPRIFEPFFTTKGKSHRGLGLALVYGIITNHGGGVAISSQAGTGTSARVYLPAEKNLTRNGASSGEDLRGTETVLVVDDEAMLLTMAETILTEFGYKVLTANNGQKALTVLSRGEKVDLVVTDLVMPGMGGRELVERLRQLNPDAKILCTSGYVMPQDKQMNVPYLQKPFTALDLVARVRSTLANPASV